MGAAAAVGNHTPHDAAGAYVGYTLRAALGGDKTHNTDALDNAEVEEGAHIPQGHTFAAPASPPIPE